MDENPKTIDLNADLAEGFPWDEAILARVTSASLACGAHAGDAPTARRALREAARRGVVVGAHPSYPDREGFGRRDRETTASEVECWVRDQFDFLAELARSDGLIVSFVKPHGALYNQAQDDPSVAAGVVAALVPLGLPVLGRPRSLLEKEARRLGVRFIAEGFPDRRYSSNGRLVPRSRPDAILTDPKEIRAQVLQLVKLGVETLCLHGDDPNAIELADRLLEWLREAGLATRSFV